MAVESRRVESKPLIARDSFGKSLKKQWRDEHLLLHFSRRHISSPTLVSTVKLDRYNRRIASISLPFGFPPSPAHLSSTNSSESTKYSALGSPGLEEEYEPGMPGMNAKWGSWKEPRGKRWEPSRMILLPIGFTILLATIFLTRSASSTGLFRCFPLSTRPRLGIPDHSLPQQISQSMCAMQQHGLVEQKNLWNPLTLLSYVQLFAWSRISETLLILFVETGI